MGRKVEAIGDARAEGASQQCCGGGAVEGKEGRVNGQRKRARKEEAQVLKDAERKPRRERRKSTWGKGGQQAPGLGGNKRNRKGMGDGEGSTRRVQGWRLARPSTT